MCSEKISFQFSRRLQAGKACCPPPLDHLLTLMHRNDEYFIEKGMARFPGLLNGLEGYYNQLAAIHHQFLSTASQNPLQYPLSALGFAGAQRPVAVTDTHSSSTFGPGLNELSQNPPPENETPLFHSIPGQDNNAPTPPAVSLERAHSVFPADKTDGMDGASPRADKATSALVLISQQNSVKPQQIFICTVPGQLKHGQQIHLITSNGEIFSTTVAQLTLDVQQQTYSPNSETSPSVGANSTHPLSNDNLKVSEPRSTQTVPAPSSVKLEPYPFPSNNADPVASLDDTTALNRKSPQIGGATAIIKTESEPAIQMDPMGSPEFPDDESDENGPSTSSESLLFARDKLCVSVGEDSAEKMNVDGINLEEIKEFAKTFKMKRLSLGLTQTQVGQALSMTEGPAYSQSAICRFEKLDITPKSAQKIKPVLEKWMSEIDEKIRNGQLTPEESEETTTTGFHPCLLGVPPPAAPITSTASTALGLEAARKRKRRTSFTPQALELLNQFFERNTHPSGTEMTALAESLGYDREVIRVWFCNKRQALKNTIKKLKHVDHNGPV